MARYAEGSKERVREAVDMVELVSSRTELRRAGTGRYMGRCPFHEERTASLSVDAERKLYHCFGCGAGGDALRFVQEIEGLDFVGALESLAARYGIELEVADEDPRAAERRRHRERLLELLERAAGFYVRYLWDSQEARPAREYLAGRGLEETVLREFRVGYAPSAWDTLLTAGRAQGFSNAELYDSGLAQRAKGEGRIYDRFRRRIMFPLTDPRGRVLGFGARAMGDGQPKYLNSSDGEVYHKGEHLFGADLARVHATRADEVVVAEGYTDVLALHQAGVRHTVGLMGTALTERQVGELAKLGRRVLLALDADSAGQDAMLRAARMAQGRRLELRVVPLPAGTDPADLVAREGPQAAAAIVAASVPFVRFRVDRELEAGDLDSAEGKDRVIEALRPVFATLAPSALREELLALVSGRLALPPANVSSWLAPAGEGSSPRSGSSAGGGSGGAPAPRRDGASRVATADPVARAERVLLAMCLAAGEAGREMLERLTGDALSVDVNRRAAEHLREHREAPEDLVSDEDRELGRLVSAIVAQASQQPASRSDLQGQLARVEYVHLEREIEAAKAARAGGITELRAKLDRVKERLDEAWEDSIDEQRPAS